MRWSYRIAEVAGIGIDVHASFLLIVAWVALSAWGAQQSLAAVLVSVLFILALFACVALHELGHALAAKRYGIRTRDITLLPIGGVARLERMPANPFQELVVALAGPAVNVAIAAALWLWLGVTGALAPAGELGLLGGPFLERLMVVNVALVLFNLLPAFPMDGGRVLRALLAMRLDYERATDIAAGVGRAMAVLFGLFGLFFNPFLMFIALFVWIGAGREAALARRMAPFGMGRVERLDPYGPPPPGPYLDLDVSGAAARPVWEEGPGWPRTLRIFDRGRLVGVVTVRGAEDLARLQWLLRNGWRPAGPR